MKIVLFLFAILLASCSKIDMAMKWADWMIVKETDSYFDLTDTQNKDLKNQVQKDLARVKKENFPQIAKFLRKVADQAEVDKISVEEILQLQNEFQKTVRAALNQFQTTALDFSMKASAEQIEHFKKKYNKQTEKHLDDVKTDKDKFKLQKQRFEKWTDEWMGGLTSEQRVALESDIKAFPFPWDLQIRSREFSLKKFLEAQKSRSTLKTYMDQLEDERDPEYENALKDYQAHLRVYIVSLYRSLSKDQKKYLLKKLRDRAQEFEGLARDP